MSDSGVRIVAPMLSAFALLRFGPAGVIILDVATFVVSAGRISLLPSSLRLSSVSILYPIFVRTTLLAGQLAFGWLLTTQAIGEGIMSLFLARFLPRTGPVQSLGFAAGGLALAGLSLIFIAPNHLLVSDLLLNALYGAMVAATSVHLLTF